MPTNAAEPQAVLPQILVAATFTAAPLEEPLQFWFRELALPHQAAFAPYQQLFQTLLDPAGPLAQNKAGVNAVFFRFEDLDSEHNLARIEAHTRELFDALIRAVGLFPAPLLVCACPASSGFLETAEAHSLTDRLTREMSERLAGHPHLYLLSAEKIIGRFQVTQVEDPIADRSGHIPYHEEFFSALATALVRFTLALERKPLKVIAFDCDNTIWTGVCGEDGPQGVRIDQGRRALQAFLKQRKEAGVLLAICSKNNEADVRETFASHPEMVLRWEDIAASRINWEAKSQNLLELAFELNLGLDSFAFIDDDPKECGEVKSELPEVVTLQIPHTSSALPHFLDHAWLFDQPRRLTAEDRERTRMYAEQLERSRFEKQAANLRGFLAGLRLEILFAPVTPETLPRAAQLTQRTNQMNTSLVRYTETELSAALAAGKQAFTVTVSDRFGSYGLVGLVLFRAEESALHIENLLLSCRALGRGVEYKMLTHAAELAGDRSTVKLDVRRGPRNQPALQLIQAVHQAPLPTTGEFVLEFQAVTLRNFSFADQRTAGTPPRTEPRPSGSGSSHEPAAGTEPRPSGSGPSHERTARTEPRPPGSGSSHERTAGTEPRPSGSGSSHERTAGTEPRPSGSGSSHEPPQPAETPQPPYQRIAETLTTAARIHAAVLAARRDRAPLNRKQATPPQNELQARLAAIWCSLLGLNEVGIDEDFFDLGGHSLLAVQLLSRIHQQMDVDLPDSVIYGEKLRIDNLARAIELHQLGVSDQSAYDAMLAEIESLSDEEVAALLAQQEGNA